MKQCDFDLAFPRSLDVFCIASTRERILEQGITRRCFPFFRAVDTQASSDFVHRASVCILLLSSRQNGRWPFELVDLLTLHSIVEFDVLPRTAGVDFTMEPLREDQGCYLMPAAKAILDPVRFSFPSIAGLEASISKYIQYHSDVSNDYSCLRRLTPHGRTAGLGKSQALAKLRSRRLRM